MRWVLFRADDEEGEPAKATAETIDALLSEADEVTRNLLRIVATATSADDPPRLRDLADELDLEGKALRDRIAELNDQHVAAGGRELLELRAEKAVGVHGQTGTIVFVGMRPDVAALIRAAGRRSEGSTE
ncbi:MAG: hypothetical protein ACOYXM_09130 [Actinomycetota bacterium]